MTHLSAAELQSRFARRIEAEYDRRKATYRKQGVAAELAHELALEEVKELGREALEELRSRGLFPWADVATVEPEKSHVH